MDRRLLLDYLARERKGDLSAIIPRDLELKSIEGKATLIVGPRRAGKTYLLYQLRKKDGPAWLGVLASVLRGRSLPYLLLPFSFGEFLRARGVKARNILLMEEEEG